VKSRVTLSQASSRVVRTCAGRATGGLPAPNLVVALVLLLTGCGKPPNKGKGGENKKQDVKSLSQTVQTTSGSALVKEAPPKNDPYAKRKPLWYIEWKETTMRLTPQGLTGGSMKNVSGHLFDNDAPGSQFQADTGQGFTVNRKLTKLVLDGNVRVERFAAGSKESEAVLTCDSITYDATNEVIHAKGHVRIKGKVGTIGTLSEVLATKNLDRIATPGMFYEK